MERLTITAQTEVQGIAVSITATMPCDTVRHSEAGLISEFSPSELLDLGQRVSAALIALLGSAETPILESLAAAAKNGIQS